MLNNEPLANGFNDFGSLYLEIKSWRTNSESLKSLALWSFACLYTPCNVYLKSS